MNKIKNLVTDLERYIDGCGRQPLSGGKKIIVERAIIDEFISELNLSIPEELDRSEKIIGNRDAILQDAREKAQDIYDRITQQSSQMLEEHELVQQAKEKADEILEYARSQAQQIVNEAVEESNAVKLSSLQYTDDVLAGIQAILGRGIQSSQYYFDQYLNELKSSLATVTDNRGQLGFSGNYQESSYQEPETADEEPETQPQDQQPEQPEEFPEEDELLEEAQA